MLRRIYSVPERLALFGYAAGAAAAVYPAVSRVTGLQVLCPLKTVTGIPCPVCGMTTGTHALAMGDFAAAFRANPAVYGMAALAIAMIPFLIGRLTGIIPEPKLAKPTTRRAIGSLALVAALASWIFQLRRAGLI